MDGLEVFAILIISIIVIMMFQGSLGMPVVTRKEHRHIHHKHHHPYHPHRRHPHHKHHHHPGRLYEGYANENLFKNSSDVEQRNYGVYGDDKIDLAAEIFSEV